MFSVLVSGSTGDFEDAESFQGNGGSENQSPGSSLPGIVRQFKLRHLFAVAARFRPSEKVGIVSNLCPAQRRILKGTLHDIGRSFDKDVKNRAKPKFLAEVQGVCNGGNCLGYGIIILPGALHGNLICHSFRKLRRYIIAVHFLDVLFRGVPVGFFKRTVSCLHNGGKPSVNTVGGSAQSVTIGEIISLHPFVFRTACAGVDAHTCISKGFHKPLFCRHKRFLRTIFHPLRTEAGIFRSGCQTVSKHAERL